MTDTGEERKQVKHETRKTSRRSPAPFPDDEFCLVAPRGNGAYGLRLAQAVPHRMTESFWPRPKTEKERTAFFEHLSKHELPPAEKIPDDALAAALRCGFITNTAVSDALDSAGQASVCLCCYRVHGTRRARALARQLQLIQRYYAEDAYACSGAVYRNLRALISDVPREAQQQIKAFVGALDTTPAAVREANRWPGLCFAAPECGQARVLWVYSTARGRRFLRKLGKRWRCPPQQPTILSSDADQTGQTQFGVQISVAVADPSTMPRFWYKMYVARLGDDGVGAEQAPAIVAAFWALVVATAEQIGQKPGKGSKPTKAPEQPCRSGPPPEEKRKPPG